VSNYQLAGEMEIRGKTVKIVLDPQSKDPVRFFCFLDDVEGMVSRERSYVKIYKDQEAAT